MSVHDGTQMPMTPPRDGGAFGAGDQTVITRDATFATYQRQLKLMIRSGVKFSQIEEWIGRTPAHDEEQSALWLYAWSLNGLAGCRSREHRATSSLE